MVTLLVLELLEHLGRDMPEVQVHMFLMELMVIGMAAVAVEPVE